MSDASGLTRTAPQRVQHSDGWSFASAGRYAMRYSDSERDVHVPVEDGATVTMVYVDELERLVDDAIRTPLTPEELDIVLPRVLLGMQELMDGRFEVHRTSS